MIGNRIAFSVRERRNTFARGGKEWTLYASCMGDVSEWPLITWERKPTVREEAEAKRFALRSFAFYHAHLKIPPFDLEVVESQAHSAGKDERG